MKTNNNTIWYKIRISFKNHYLNKYCKLSRYKNANWVRTRAILCSFTPRWESQKPSCQASKLSQEASSAADEGNFGGLLQYAGESNAGGGDDNAYCSNVLNDFQRQSSVLSFQNLSIDGSMSVCDSQYSHYNPSINEPVVSVNADPEEREIHAFLDSAGIYQVNIKT